ncbi:MAG TPA: phage terminase large subunit [Rhodopila sp.]|uniref:phage terminase large subunit n=1 Tax=Rhodopila sp. TaxID=2480087 RepID=UPI002B60DC51|nr:phage terminase large subunit [Rhodopila sp.]HVY13723.1 phage terminase large subunit [Rhodopila sp.]
MDTIERTIFRRAHLRGTLLAWVEEALKDLNYHPARHHRLLIAELEKLSCGVFDRLMVLMPPGSAKSTYASILFPTWWFTQHPKTSILAASHSAGLAEQFSRRVRTLIDTNKNYLGFQLKAGHASAAAWATTSGGEYAALGVRGPIAGRRADLVIIDDPVKSQADADSIRQRDHIWEWYKADVSPRIKPGGKVVLIMTRWHPDDLGGQLLRQPEDDWRVLRLPALAEEEDPLGREVGEPLWPDWEDHAALSRRRALIGERIWSALYQQQPVAAQMRLFNVERITVLDDVPPAASNSVVRAWDLAATINVGQNDPDWTVGLRLQRDRTGRLIVEDIVRLRGTPSQVEDAIVQTARSDGRNVIISLPEDPGQAGRSQIAYLTRQLAGFHVIATRETGSKVARATPLASQIETGNLLIARARWNAEFVDELRTFPFGRKDDQVDALARAFTTVIERGESTRTLHHSLLVR